MHKLIRPPSPAMVVACLALFMAGTGAGVAVIKAMPRNSVGTAQLKANAVVSSKVKNHSLKAADFASGQIPKGPKGDTGAAGAAGAAGAKGAAGATKVITRGASGAVSYYYSSATASCATGEVATGGGVTWGYSGTVFPVVLVSTPVSDSAGVPHAWAAEIYNEDGYSYGSVVRADVYVICASP